MTDATAEAVTRVQARPVRWARISIVIALVVGAVLVACGVALPETTDGVQFTVADQVGVAGTGVLIAIGIMCFARPRMVADASGVDTRGFWGGYRHIDWDLIVAVEFPPRRHYARLVLPGDELIPLYAVQRADGEASVAVMEGLRALQRMYH